MLLRFEDQDSPEERNAKAYETLELVDLKGWRNPTPTSLVEGWNNGSAFARALATEPDILLMDEAFSALIR